MREISEGSTHVCGLEGGCLCAEGRWWWWSARVVIVVVVLGKGGCSQTVLSRWLIISTETAELSGKTTHGGSAICCLLYLLQLHT